MAHRETGNEGQASQGLENASCRDGKGPRLPRNCTVGEDLPSWNKKVMLTLLFQGIKLREQGLAPLCSQISS